MLVRVAGVRQVETEGGQKPSDGKDVAWKPPPGRAMARTSPWRSFAPPLETMFRAGPDVQPYSDEKAFERTVTSRRAAMGSVAVAVWRPQLSSLLAPSRVKV